MKTDLADLLQLYQEYKRTKRAYYANPKDSNGGLYQAFYYAEARYKRALFDCHEAIMKVVMEKVK